MGACGRVWFACVRVSEQVLLALKAGVLFDVPLLTRLGNLNIIHDLMLQLKPQLCSQG